MHAEFILKSYWFKTSEKKQKQKLGNYCLNFNFESCVFFYIKSYIYSTGTIFNRYLWDLYFNLPKRKTVHCRT